MFLKENCNGDINGCAYEDVRKHRETIKKEEADPTKVATESVFITVAVGAHEVWDVATFDTLGAYIYIKTDKYVMILLDGSLDELMVKVAPKIYKKYVIMSSKGEPLLYVQMKNSLYVLLLSTLLLYRNLVKDLEAYGFQINPYDPCVANNTIKNKHMTLV